jgi:hypothetical protein
LTVALHGGEWSASCPGCALAPGKGPMVPIVQEVGLAPEPVWTQKLQEKSFRLCWGPKLDHPVIQMPYWVSYLTYVHIGYSITSLPPEYFDMKYHVDLQIFFIKFNCAAVNGWLNLWIMMEMTCSSDGGKSSYITKMKWALIRTGRRKDVHI